MDPTYKIVRFYFDESHPDHHKVIDSGLSLEDARAHCSDDSTKGDGWFDGYESEDYMTEGMDRRLGAGG